MLSPAGGFRRPLSSTELVKRRTVFSPCRKIGPGDCQAPGLWTDNLAYHLGSDRLFNGLRGAIESIFRIRQGDLD